MGDMNQQLHEAALRGTIKSVKRLIKQGSKINHTDQDGNTPLHSAAEASHLDVTEFLISQGAEVNKGDNCDNTALHLASLNGHLDVAKYLISQGADVTKGNNKGLTALHSAASNGHFDVTQYLISQGAEVNKGKENGWTALHSAAQDGHLDITQYLISQGAEVNKGKEDGWTALHSAAQEGHLDITTYLISQGAEVNKGDTDGRTPLHHAVQNGYIDVVKILLEGGALSDTGDINGHTPLQLSLFLGYQSIAELFIDRSHSKLDQNYLTDIHLAIQYGHTSSIEKLVSEGADLNVQSTDGQTCLHKAIKLCYKSVKIVQETDTLRKISDEYYKGELPPAKALVFYLLENGARLDVKDETGNLPIQYAQDEVIKQMILPRVSSLLEIQSSRDGPSTPGILRKSEIELEDHGVFLFIPPGAVHQNDRCKITMTILRDPPSVDIQDDESVACYGIRCDPPNMIFHQPVEIRIPHANLVINPDQVKPDIVSRVWDLVNGVPRTSRRIRSSSSPDQPPYCRVNNGHLELYIGYCAEWWVLIPLEQQVIRHQLMCTPYIPETVERGKDIEVHLHVHADVPGMDAKVLHDEKHQAYRKAHRSVPFSIISHSGDVTVELDCEGKMAETKLLSLKEIHSRMRHKVVFNVPPSVDDTPFNVITTTVTQSGHLGVSRSMAFVIKHEDGIMRPEYSPIIREIEGTSQNDLTDKVVQKIAEGLSIDDFYDLGVLLGFSIRQLDAIEYKRLKDRQKAIYDMLISWKRRQMPHQNVKEVLLSLLKSEETEAEKTIDITPTSEISDQDLLKLARHIKWTNFTEIGTKLGFSANKLENIKHRTLQNRKDAIIQMLCMWKASQKSGLEAAQTLKCILESVSLASTAECTDGSLCMFSSVTPEKRVKPSESIEHEDMDIITTSDTEGDEIKDDLDQCGGTPNTEELCSVALPVKSLSLARLLGKALNLNDNLIVGFIDLPSSSVHTIARQLVDIWLKDLKEEEKEDKFAKLLSEFHIPNVETASTGREEISKAIVSKADLLDLCHRLSVKPSGVLQIVSKCVAFPPHMIGRSALKMLKEWVHQGGTRKRLLEVAQAFRFNGAAVKIAEAMKFQLSYMPVISHGIIDYKGGELTLDELGIAVSIPEGAIPKGLRSVVTLRVSTHDTPRLPLREGEVVITPVIEGSLTHELLKPATVVIAHCTNHHERKDDPSVILYTKTGLGTFGRRHLTPRTSQILKDKIKFRTRHLQVWALSSTDLQGLQLRCVVFQPLFMTPEEKPTLRVYILHPYRNHIEDITRKEKYSSVPYCQVSKELRFSIDSTSKDLQIVFHDGTQSNQRMMPIKSILSGKCSPLNFELEFSPEEKGKKNVHIDILQESAILVKKAYLISIEDEPDYTVDHTDSQGRLQYVSNNLFETLAGVIQTAKDLKSLGYQLGFPSVAVEKYINNPDSSFDCVSRSDFGEMLRDWRRKVRPDEQVDELHLALQKSGLGHTAEVILPKLSSRSRFTQVSQTWKSEKVTTEAGKNNYGDPPKNAQTETADGVEPINHALGIDERLTEQDTPSPSTAEIVTTEVKKNNYDDPSEKTQSDGTDSAEPIIHALGIEESFTEQDAPSPSTAEISAEESRDRDFDNVLTKIAKQMYKDDEIDSLGGQLGFEHCNIQRYIQTNVRYQHVTYMGTLSMLRDWRKNTTRAEERKQLKKALIAIKHRRLADVHLNDDMAGTVTAEAGQLVTSPIFQWRWLLSTFVATMLATLAATIIQQLVEQYQ